MNGYGRSFVVYSQFSPISNSNGMLNRPSMMPGRGMMMEPGQDWCFPINDAGDRIILVGLNPQPFDAGRKEDIRNTMIIAGVLVILGLAGFISMFWMHNYRITKQALQDTTAFADEVVTSLPMGLVATDKNGKIAFYNSAAERISGIDFSQALGKDPQSILPSPFCGLKETLNLGETISEEEMECEFSKGKIVPLSISASSIITEEGHNIGQVMIMRDLGEIRRLQAEIRRKEKLAAIGGLAAGVAHEIRNPLSSIKGIASYYKAKFTDGSDDQEMAGVMIEEVDRLSRVISELLEFARPMKLNLKQSNVNDLLAHSVRLVQQEASSKNVLISLNTAPDPMMAYVDSDRLTQCLLNLYLNALQAMEDGGQLSISGFIKDNRLEIDIQDTGPGIDAEDLNKIFDPYFTTKPKGTGLGLAIVHNVIEAHDGSVKVRSVVGQGSVFTIGLPLNPTV
jgi:two-component system sensor histidine kinase HydH